jgi:hypothetical protein
MKKQKTKRSAPIQSIFDDKKKEHDANKEDTEASRAHAEKAKRAYAAWAGVANFPYSIIEAEYHPAYVKLILALGETLKAEGWQARIDKLVAGPPAKKIAVEMLRCALASDEYALTDLLRQSIGAGEFGYDVDNWLRVGLMNEVLGITEIILPTHVANAAAQLDSAPRPVLIAPLPAGSAQDKPGLRPTYPERKQRVLEIVTELGKKTSVKTIIKAMKDRGLGMRPQTIRKILRELKDEGKYHGPS